MWFSADSAVLTVAQAACVALPGAGLPAWAARVRMRGLALVAPVSLAAVVGAIAVMPGAANALTWVALILIPLGAAVAVGWAARGARSWYAPLAIPLLVLAWASPHSRAGQAAAIVLIAGSAVSAGRLVVGASPLRLLAAGLAAMAVLDGLLVFSGGIDAPNSLLVAASPGPGLPQFQAASFGAAGLGYGDLFAAALVGAVLAPNRASQLKGAIAVLAVSLAFHQLFIVYNSLPGTIPPAVVLIGYLALRSRRSVARRVRVYLWPLRRRREAFEQASG